MHAVSPALSPVVCCLDLGFDAPTRPFGPELGPIVMNLVVAEISRVKHVEFSSNAAGGSAHVQIRPRVYIGSHKPTQALVRRLDDRLLHPISGLRL